MTFYYILFALSPDQKVGRIQSNPLQSRRNVFKTISSLWLTYTSDSMHVSCRVPCSVWKRGAQWHPPWLARDLHNSGWICRWGPLLGSRLKVHSLGGHHGPWWSMGWWSRGLTNFSANCCWGRHTQICINNCHHKYQEYSCPKLIMVFSF